MSDTSRSTARCLDDVGWRILHELQCNARLSFAELGRRVGLSVPAVTERVRKLEEAGIITGYRAEVDRSKVGLPIHAFIRMSVVGDVFNRVVAAVKAMPEVLECHRGTGADSFTMKVAVASVAHLESLIDRLTPFGTTSTSIVLSSPVTRRDVERSGDARRSQVGWRSRVSPGGTRRWSGAGQVPPARGYVRNSTTPFLDGTMVILVVGIAWLRPARTRT
jgi:Lrp/AsnC family transcriptional regulator, leucine-responsive regulatory protein